MLPALGLVDDTLEAAGWMYRRAANLHDKLTAVSCFCGRVWSIVHFTYWG